MAKNVEARARHLANVRPQFAESFRRALLWEPFAESLLFKLLYGMRRAVHRMPVSMPTLFSGTSGFAYPSWKPEFYPEKLPAKKFLSYYATRLNAVEVNYTFRRLPSASTLENWVNDTRAGLCVSAESAHAHHAHLEAEAIGLH